MVVEFRDGRKFMVMPTDQDIIVVNKNGGYVQFSSYNEMLDCKLHKDLDVMKVWGLGWAISDIFIIEEQNRELLWQREEQKYHVVLPLGTFGEKSRHLNYDIGDKSYFFGTDDEDVPNEFGSGYKTEFTKGEVDTLKWIIKSSIEIVEIKGEKE